MAHDTIETDIAVIKTELKAIKRVLDDLVGDNGINVRVARCEEKTKLLYWIIGAMGPILLVIVGFFAQWMRG